MRNEFLFLMLAALSAGASTTEPIVSAYSRPGPRTDGVITRDEYRFAATFRGAANYRQAASTHQPAKAGPRKAECAVTWDEDYLYLAVRSETQKGGVLPAGGPRDPYWTTESVEFWFDPPKELRQAEFARFGSFQMMASWNGKVLLMHHNPGFGLPARPWKAAEGALVRNTVCGDFWDCEIRIPAAAFGAGKLAAGEWGMVLGRNFVTHTSEQCTFGPFMTENGAYTDTTCYSRLSLKRGVNPTRFNGAPKTILSSPSPTVPCGVSAKVRTTGRVPALKWRRFFASQDVGGNGYFGLQEVANADGSVHMGLFYHVRNRKVFKNFTHNRVPEAGEETALAMNVFPDRIVYYIDGAKTGEILTDAPVRAEDLGPILPGGGEPGIEILSLKVSPRALSDEEVKLAAQGEKGLAGELKWFPSRSLIACDLSFPKPASKDDMPVLRVTDAKGVTILERRVPLQPDSGMVTGGKRPMMVVHEAVPVAPEGSYLPDGDYTMMLSLRGQVEIEKKFRMKRYPWFGTDVATKDVLLPGFTPVKARGKSVEVVGRRYVFADSGLPAEFWSQGEQLLARPIALTGVMGRPGETVVVSGISETTARIAGTLASGRVEQDGFIVLDLALPETHGDVALEIPIKGKFAELFHACGIGLRGNPAGFLPKGTGRIFGSRDVSHSIDNVLPYVWVGTDTRGLCYAIDTDQGWEHTKERDATEIFRETDGTVVVRLNLVNGAGRHAARRITVTLQASPTKPMPKRWRGWVDAYDVPAERNTLCNCSNPTWGCYIVGMARYPAFMEWEYVHQMRKSADTGKVDDAWCERWIDRCWKARAEQPDRVPWLVKKPADEAAKTLRAHAYAGLRRPRFLHKHKNTVLYYYTCNADPCDGLYELDVMKDEWGRFASVYGSHADYAVYYLKRMCEEGMTGVYNDNTFFRLNYDWVAGNAWIDEKGDVRPSFQLFANRDFCRRQILAMLEAGVKDPWLTMHHTNANILPVLTYATNTMGMEWKYGADDYQDRWTPDYVRTVNQGYQGGFFATSLEGLFNLTPENRTRVTRTMLAVLLPHEVQPTLQESGDHGLVRKVLGLKQAFGVAEDDCVYTAYWDPENPLVQRGDVLVSAYRRGDRLLAVVGSYAKEDVKLALQLKDGRILAATNAETGAALAVTDGMAVLPLARHDFALFELKKELK